MVEIRFIEVIINFVDLLVDLGDDRDGWAAII